MDFLNLTRPKADKSLASFDNDLSKLCNSPWSEVHLLETLNFIPIPILILIDMILIISICFFNSGTKTVRLSGLTQYEVNLLNIE